MQIIFLKLEKNLRIVKPKPDETSIHGNLPSSHKCGALRLELSDIKGINRNFVTQILNGRGYNTSESNIRVRLAVNRVGGGGKSHFWLRKALFLEAKSPILEVGELEYWGNVVRKFRPIHYACKTLNEAEWESVDNHDREEMLAVEKVSNGEISSDGVSAPSRVRL
ncbi:hypothetical protein Tco_0005459 [Tanacetum coccineum]